MLEQAEQGRLSLLSMLEDRVEMEEALRSAASEWQATFDASPDAIFLLDGQNTLIRSNQSTQMLFGASGSQMIGKSYNEILTRILGECPLCSNLNANQHKQLSGEYRVREKWYESRHFTHKSWKDKLQAAWSSSGIFQNGFVQLKKLRKSRINWQKLQLLFPV